MHQMSKAVLTAVIHTSKNAQLVRYDSHSTGTISFPSHSGPTFTCVYQKEA